MPMKLAQTKSDHIGKADLEVLVFSFKSLMCGLILRAELTDYRAQTLK